LDHALYDVLDRAVRGIDNAVRAGLDRRARDRQLGGTLEPMA
jgi:hypothetical protein